MTITATVLGDPPTVSVTFCDNATTVNPACTAGTVLCTVALVPGTTSSAATCATSFARPGVHALAAFYAGDGNFTATATAPAQINVTVNAQPAQAVAAPALDRWLLMLLSGLIIAVAAGWAGRRGRR